MLNVGTLLADHQVIHQPQDIFHFYYDELLEVLKKPVASHELIDNRKQEFEENRHKKTPPAYGTPPQTGEDPLLERVFGKMGPPEVDETQKIFKGSAASRGVYTGVVKIISDPSQFSKLEQGDILVCETTAPAWTTLFSLAGAIVTNAGGILSHAGTVAREYKLPAVLGTK
ncbi:PEP-utilizing enzyme, partial [Priestia aryabhattai]|uniref:PEP-utilizing enzyme n=1 Tax=Priestia aryabhattai TaxID=412384 RepID=UPI002E1DDA42